MIETLNMKYQEFIALGPAQSAPLLQKLSQLLGMLVASQENLLSYDLLMTHLDEAFMISVSVLDQRTFVNKRSKAITQSIYEQ